VEYRTRDICMVPSHHMVNLPYCEPFSSEQHGNFILQNIKYIIPTYQNDGLI
jgi:hypothetical protein